MAIRLIENFRTVFYTPFYAPAALGTYQAEGLDVRILTSPAAARTVFALVDGEGDVSWGGVSRLMGMLQTNPARAPVAFCEVVGRDPFFLLGRTPNPDFQFGDLRGLKVATVCEVPAPWMCLHYELKLAGIEPSRILRTAERPMAENVALFRAGEIDVVQVFHPFARQLTDEGAAHLWHTGADHHPTTYTTLNTTRDFAVRNPDVLLRMCRAVYRAQQWIAEHDGAEIAAAVASFFPEIPASLLANCCNHYRALGVWNRTPLMSRAGFEWVRDAGLAVGRVKKRFSYEECVDMRFAEQAVHELSASHLCQQGT